MGADLILRKSLFFQLPDDFSGLDAGQGAPGQALPQMPAQSSIDPAFYRIFQLFFVRQGPVFLPELSYRP